MKITRLFSLLLFLLQFFAIYLISSGFFLKREQVAYISEKNPVDGTDDWFKPKAKVMFFIIDALRFDFLHFNETLVGHEQYPYQNKFVKLHKILKENPQNSLFFKAYADPPTVTVHRVQSIVTGNLPPFVEITENFGSSAVSEDNIIRKLVSSNRTVNMVGDYIWTDLFPSEFKTSFPVQSFDIHDFDSVDNEVKKRVFSMIKKNDSDFLIAHALGVDHIGHTHGIYHEKMGEKLTEMDDLAAKIIQSIDDNTVLFIMGDHGMTNEGDHGGSSHEETETGIAVYYKKGFRKYQEPDVKEIMKSMTDNPKILKQMDLTPTLAMLLGLPIPYSNIGQIINDFYINEESGKNKTSVSFLKNVMRDNYLNLRQTCDYLLTVQDKFDKFPKLAFAELNKNCNEIDADIQKFFKFIELNSEIKKEEEIVKFGVETITKIHLFGDDVYKLLQISNSYDLFLMISGIALSACCVFLALALIQILNPPMRYNKVFYQWDNHISFNQLWMAIVHILKTSRFLQFSGVLSVCLSIGFRLTVLKSFAMFVLLFAFWLLASLLKESSQQLNKLRQSLKDGLKWSHTTFLLEAPASTLLAVTVCTVQIVLRLSIVFTRTERDLLQSIMTVILLLLFVKAMTISDKCSNKTKIIASILTVSMIIYILPYYDPSVYPEECSVNHEPPFYYAYKPIKIIAPLVPLLVFIQQVSKQILLQTQGKKKKTTLLGLMHVISLALVSIYYLAACFKEDYQKDFLIQILIPRIIYLLNGLNCLLNYFIPSQPQSPKKLKEEEEYKLILTNEQICLVQILFLLVGSNAVASFVFLFLAFKLLNYCFMQTKAESVSYPFIIALVSLYGYFCTGHTNQVTNIRVSQGFVGFEEFNFFISGLLVLINTMSSFILGMVFISSYIKQVKVNGEMKGKNQKRVGELFSAKTWLLYGIFFTASFVGTGINCSLNLESLLLVYDFAPKYLIDTSIYMFVLVSTLIFGF